MDEPRSYNTNVIKMILTVLIAFVWLIKGLICKVLNLVPRHQQIVARILGEDYAGIITRTIGMFEILMAIWILSRIHSKLCAATQIVLVALMNVIEFAVVPDLLLFGRMNIVLATVLIAVIYINEFVLLSGKRLTA